MMVRGYADLCLKMSEYFGCYAAELTLKACYVLLLVTFNLVLAGNNSAKLSSLLLYFKWICCAPE
ncbi:hypothetical protein DVQ78_11805 [Yersinia enterocolitica]|nr:hypothetical protein [Yersinia enterocolitica]